MASAMPVLPDDGSMIVRPGVRVPSASASWTIRQAMRSLTEPPGFWPSSLARIRTSGLGLRLLTSTIGVLPMRSSTEAKTAMEREILNPSDQVDNATGSSSIPPSTIRNDRSTAASRFSDTIT